MRGDFAHTMSMTTLVSRQGGVAFSSGQLSAFAGVQLRGVQASESLAPFGPYASTALFQITLYGSDNGDVLTFNFFDGTQYWPITETIAFTVNENRGDVFSPVILTATAPPPPSTPSVCSAARPTCRLSAAQVAMRCTCRVAWQRGCEHPTSAHVTCASGSLPLPQRLCARAGEGARGLSCCPGLMRCSGDDKCQVACWGAFGGAFTPYEPRDGWQYFLVAARAEPWPTCGNIFLSYSWDGRTIDLANEDNTFILVGTDETRTFRLKMGSTDRFVSYSSGCAERLLFGSLGAGSEQGGSGQEGSGQLFRFVGTDGGVQFDWKLEAVERAACAARFVGVAAACADTTGSMVGLAGAATFRLYPYGREDGSTLQMAANSDDEAADPFVWDSAVQDDPSPVYRQIGTGGDIWMQEATWLDGGFHGVGDALGGTPEGWAESAAKWAPENFRHDGTGGTLLFSTPAADHVHRIGWVQSTADGVPLSYTSYAAAPLDLGGTSGGEIDPHVFRDDDGTTYLLWKSDDNAEGAATTRLWMQEVAISVGSVDMLGSPQVVLDSSGLWWASSWVSGGSLIEGPQLLRHGDWYYLFFAAGRFCQSDYFEGVARASSVWGPYEKLSVPLLSTPLVGSEGDAKIIGPGHASFVRDRRNGAWFAVFHGSKGHNCARFAFVAEMRFADGPDWPYIAFPDCGTEGVCSCSSFASLIDARGLSPPEWCYSAVRAASQELCETYYVAREEGTLSRCMHDGATCRMSSVRFDCGGSLAASVRTEASSRLAASGPLPAHAGLEGKFSASPGRGDAQQCAAPRCRVVGPCTAIDEPIDPATHTTCQGLRTSQIGTPATVRPTNRTTQKVCDHNGDVAVCSLSGRYL